MFHSIAWHLLLKQAVQTFCFFSYVNAVNITFLSKWNQLVCITVVTWVFSQITWVFSLHSVHHGKATVHIIHVYKAATKQLVHSWVLILALPLHVRAPMQAIHLTNITCSSCSTRTVMSTAWTTSKRRVLHSQVSIYKILWKTTGSTSETFVSLQLGLMFKWGAYWR